jgi:hypothetical protein
VNVLPQDYTMLVWRSHEDDQYIARCLEIPSCIGIDETPGEAIIAAYNTVKIHLAYRIKCVLPLPQTITEDQRHGRRTLHQIGTYELIRAAVAKKAGSEDKLGLHVVQEDEEFDYEAMLRNELHLLAPWKPRPSGRGGNGPACLDRPELLQYACKS